jgi:hypothetical protein
MDMVDKAGIGFRPKPCGNHSVSGLGRLAGKKRRELAAPGNKPDMSGFNG